MTAFVEQNCHYDVCMRAERQFSSGYPSSAEFCENLLNTAGVRFAGPIAILRNWTFCLFYVMAELWGSVVVSLLFWGFANQVRI